MGWYHLRVKPLHSGAYRNVTLGTIAIPLDLKRNVVLERFELGISSTDISLVHGWLCGTLRTITLSTFNEFVISLSNGWIPLHPENNARWGDIDVLFESLARRNSDFKVVFRKEFPYGTLPTYGGVPSFIANYLPLVSSKGLLRLEENRSWKLDSL